MDMQTHISARIPGDGALPDLALRSVKSSTGLPLGERREVPLDELRFCHLSTPADIDRIRHLREEIHLPQSVLADPLFPSLEKKETK